MSHTTTTRPTQATRTTQVESTLRDLAYVFHLTAQVKKAITKDNNRFQSTGYAYPESAA